MLGRCTTFALVLLAPTLAYAGGSGSSSIACGWTTNVGWNAPKGATIYNRSDGPVKGAIDGIGEWRTHSILSNGNGWITHATMKSPGTTGWPTYCSTPADPNDLYSGFAGAEQITVGALYTYLYMQPAGSSILDIGYNRGDGGGTYNYGSGSAIADWTWSSMPYQWVASQSDGTQGFYTLGFNDAYGFHRFQYTLNQFRNLGPVNTGGVAWNNGIVCSTLLAYASNKAGQGTINAFTYDHSHVQSGVSGIWNGVYNDCNSSLGFWKGLGGGASCFDFNGICDEAADQLTNCFTSGACNTNDNSIWQGVSNDSTATAYAISPDNDAGYRPGQSWWTQGNGPWAWDSQQTLTWNAGGNTYACWY